MEFQALLKNHTGDTKADYPIARKLMLEMASCADAVIATIAAELPVDFPQYISDAIFKGLSGQAANIVKWGMATLILTE